MHARPGLAGQEAGLQLRGAGRGDCGADVLELGDGLLVAMCFDESLRARERCLDAAALVGRDAVGEIPRVDFEPAGEPRDRLSGRARLAALDLAHVLLREPIARELALRQARGNAELAQSLTEPDGCGARCLCNRSRGGSSVHAAACFKAQSSGRFTFAQPPSFEDPPKGWHFGRNPW